MAEACTALAFPVVSGNVSLYNETNGIAIPPTPAIGGIGLIPDLAHMATIALKRQGDVLMLLGAEAGHLGQSLYMQVMLERTHGAPPPVDLDAERRAGDLVRGLIRDGCLTAVHDVSDGGLLVAIAEMALAGGHGVELDADPGPPAPPCAVVRRGPGALRGGGVPRPRRRHPQGGGGGQGAAQAAGQSGWRCHRARRRTEAAIGRP